MAMLVLAVAAVALAFGGHRMPQLQGLPPGLPVSACVVLMLLLFWRYQRRMTRLAGAIADSVDEPAPQAVAQSERRKIEGLGAWIDAEGHCTEVANALEISYKTVANTTSLLKQKLGAKSHSDLIRIAVEMGLD